MKRLINILYSFTAGLEQACLTFETIKQAHKAAVVMAVRNTPEAKAPMGFAGNIRENPSPSFTAEEL
tara:strand:- start:483 stop:683 length:201 start_codon:yes stop_codon:yes gene_type:complete